jgi:DNA-binding LacI/PurR family transcriptional regulator
MNQTPTPTKMNPFSHQTKTQALCSYLTELANKLGPDAKLPTMQQLCDSLGVSVVTLNRALSELEGQNIIQRKHGVGIFVSPRLNQRTIGLVYDRDIFQAGTSPFCGLLVEAARTRAASSSEKFSFYLAIPSKEGFPVHDDLVEDARARRLHGILFAGESNPQAVEWLLRQDIPLVAVAYTPIAPWRVKIDWPEFVHLGVASLAKQGCKKIALWIPVGVGLGRATGEDSFAELDAFRKALKKAGLPFQPARVWENENLVIDPVPGRAPMTNQEQGFRAASDVFGPNSKETERPDGIVILDDMMTRGAVVALGQFNVQPGQDVKIATHTNRGSTVLMGYEENLTLIEIDPDEIVQASFAMLETLMDSGTPPEPTVSIKPKLRQ